LYFIYHFLIVISHTIKLLKAKHAEITEGIVRKATIGMKESESSFMDVITDIFTPLSKARVKDLGLTSEEEGRYVNRISRTIDSTGNLDRVAISEVNILDSESGC
jgi:chromosome transmission fidelity protein 18